MGKSKKEKRDIAEDGVKGEVMDKNLSSKLSRKAKKALELEEVEKEMEILEIQDVTNMNGSIYVEKTSSVPLALSISSKSGFDLLMGKDDTDALSADEKGNHISSGEGEETKSMKVKTKKTKKKKINMNQDDEDLDKILAEFSDITRDNSAADELEKIASQNKKKLKKERQKQKMKEDIDEEKVVLQNDAKLKKKKKNDIEETDDKKKGGRKPTKGTLLAMQEALKQVQAEEERLMREAEEREARAEEERRQKEEEKRLAEERKIAKKQREKEKREQLRREGKLLTAKQKADKLRAEGMLAAMRAQGMEVPTVVVDGEKMERRPGTRIRNRNKFKSTKPDIGKLKKIEVKATVVAVCEKVTSNVVEKVSNNDIKNNWDDTDSEIDEVEEKASEIIKPDESETRSLAEDLTESESSGDELEDRSKQDLARIRIAKRREIREANRSVDELRSPVVCVLGHVDTGKTKILDKLRRTNVQDGEAGGITQQIGTTNVPIEVIKEQCRMVKMFEAKTLRLPGLLVIDTPGHESFSNLRDRGSSLCDIAILVVDLMHGLEPQTIESINLLKKRKTPFVVALNKIDRLYDWKTNRHKDIEEVIASQATNTKLEFEKRFSEVVVSLAEQGLNAALFYNNPDPKTYISVVPLSAITGDGMGNLMALLVCLSQTMLAKRLSFSEELLATVLEVKAVPGLGTTIDIVLINGFLKEGQTIVVAGTEGPIVTQIKALLTPSKMQDIRVKSSFTEHKSLKASCGVKISAKDMEKAIAGLNILVAEHPDEVDLCVAEVAMSLESALNAIKLKDRGVFVQASTLGSLEALLEFLRTSKIPVAGVKIGPVVKRDVMKASVMLEHEEKYSIILAFDIKVERDAQDLADSMGVKIFQADIIYHLFDSFVAHLDELKAKKREEFKQIAVFPCKLKMLPNCIFNSRDPIVAGVVVEGGILTIGTILCVPSKEFLEIGAATSLQVNHKEVSSARKGEEVCVKIDPIPGESPKMFGRHFDETDQVVSKISRESIDACKNYFREDLQKSDWALMVELKKLFGIL